MKQDTVEFTDAYLAEVAKLLGDRYSWALHTEPVRIMMDTLADARNDTDTYRAAIEHWKQALADEKAKTAALMASRKRLVADFETAAKIDFQVDMQLGGYQYGHDAYTQAQGWYVKGWLQRHAKDEDDGK